MYANTNSRFDYISLLARTALAVLLSVTCITHAGTADAAAAFAIVVTSVKGDVRITMGGQARSVQKGSVLELPATIQTGPQSAIDLKQDRTTVSIAGDTHVEIPASAAGTPIDRVIQTSGNAFYNVGKRDSRKLRVETPYLVAVIKGTQFNVAVQGEGATVSLFEGRLEVRTPDDSDVVDLNAGEMAIRQRNDKTIRVLRMDSGEAVRSPSGGVASRSGPASPGNDNSTTPRASIPIDLLPGRGAGEGGVGVGIGNAGVGAGGTVSINSVNAGVGADAALEASAVKAGGELNVSAPVASANLEASVETATTGTSLEVGAGASASVVDVSANVGAGMSADGASVDVGAGVGVAAVDASIDAGVDIGASSAAVAADVGVDAGAVDASAAAAIDLGSDGASVDPSIGVDTGAASADLGATLDVGAQGAAADVDVGLDTAGTTADLGLTAGVDADAGTVDLGVDTAADAGVAAVDLGADTGADLGAGTVDVGTETSLDLGVADGAADTDIGVDTSGGAAVDVDAGVGGLDVGLDVDLGAGALDVDLGGALDPAPDPDPPSGGGLLGGIKRRLGGN